MSATPPPVRHAPMTARAEILTMLREDHKKVKKAFRDFDKLDLEDDRFACQALVNQTLADLELHITLEEELFYPAVRELVDDTLLIDEAEVEHGSVHLLIEQLKALSVEDEKYAATFKVLGEYVAHHVKEEETELFPQLERKRPDWNQLKAAMVARRDELARRAPPGPVPAEAAAPRQGLATAT